jgi:hypothetical protein
MLAALINCRCGRVRAETERKQHRRASSAVPERPAPLQLSEMGGKVNTGRELCMKTQTMPFEDAFASPFPDCDEDEDEGTSCDPEQERRLSLGRKDSRRDSATCRICLEGHGPMKGAVKMRDLCP